MEERPDNYKKKMMRRKQDLKDQIIIDFFFTVGLPEAMAIQMIEDIEKQFDGNFRGEEAFKHVKKIIMDSKFINS